MVTLLIALLSVGLNLCGSWDMVSVYTATKNPDGNPVSILNEQETNLSAWLALEGRDIWLGYPPKGEALTCGKYGWDVQCGIQITNTLLLIGTASDGRDVYIAVYQGGGHTYVISGWWLPFAMADGSWYGNHACSGIELEGSLPQWN